MTFTQADELSRRLATAEAQATAEARHIEQQIEVLRQKAKDARECVQLLLDARHKLWQQDFDLDADIDF